MVDRLNERLSNLNLTQFTVKVTMADLKYAQAFFLAAVVSLQL